MAVQETAKEAELRVKSSFGIKNKFMKKILLSIILAVQFTGCASYQAYKALPPEERAAFVKAEAVTWLKNNKSNVKTAIINVGLLALKNGTSDADRTIIANQMWSAAVAFRSLATGTIVSGDDIATTLKQFGRKSGSQTYDNYISDVSLLWSGIFSHLQMSENSQLAIDYLLIFAEAAEEVAAQNK